MFSFKISVIAVRPSKYYDGSIGSGQSAQIYCSLIKPMFVVQVLFIESHARSCSQPAKPTRLIDSRNNDTLFNIILLWATVPKPQPYAFYICICLSWTILEASKVQRHAYCNCLIRMRHALPPWLSEIKVSSWNLNNHWRLVKWVKISNNCGQKHIKANMTIDYTTQIYTTL